MEDERRREILGKGNEHKVFYPRSKTPNIVLKVPRLWNRLSHIGRNAAEIMREELHDAQQQIQGKDVYIPRTLILKAHKRQLGIFPPSYVIGQQYIQNDNSVPDIYGHLMQQNLPPLANRYKFHPDNFLTNSGTLYLIDPTKGFWGRIFDRSGIINLETYRKLRIQIRKVIKRN